MRLLLCTETIFPRGYSPYSRCGEADHSAHSAWTGLIGLGKNLHLLFFTIFINLELYWTGYWNRGGQHWLHVSNVHRQGCNKPVQPYFAGDRIFTYFTPFPIRIGRDNRNRTFDNNKHNQKRLRIRSSEFHSSEIRFVRFFNPESYFLV